MKKIYNKQNSFVKIQTWPKEDLNFILQKIKSVLNKN